MTQKINTIKLVHNLLAAHVQPGDICIDATAGRGHDTAVLCELVGERGKVLAFDIQAEALESTKRLLKEQGLAERASLYMDSHVHLREYASAGTIAAIVFNLGYLPGGDHSLATRGETSIIAIEQGLKLLQIRGIMTICIYHGGDSGFGERDMVLAYLRQLAHQQYTVMVTDFYNRPNHPPLAVLITKDR